MTIGLLSTVLFNGCERRMIGDDPPLRPLVYTEIAPSEDKEADAQAESPVNIAPEDLGFGLFHALVEHDRQAFESMFISSQALSELVRMPQEDARRQAGEFLRKSEILWTLFSSPFSSGSVSGDMFSRFKLSEFRLGKGRNLAGKLASPELNDLVQHWGNELRIELIGSDKVFTVRIPKIVKTPQGWRIALPLELDKSFQIFLETGMFMKSDMLTSEHYPIPLEVGNYWKYRIDKGKLDTAEDKPSDADGSKSVSEADTTVTEMITKIVHREGYWIVSFERTVNDPAAPVDEGPQVNAFSWLVTPRMVFPCMRDCRNNADSIGYLLGYMLKQTPVYIFPLEVGNKWSTAGKKDVYYKYEVRQYHNESIQVPDGAFSGAYEIFGSIEEGRESRFFVPGIGTVMRTVRSGVGQKKEVLMQHRLIL